MKKIIAILAAVCLMGGVAANAQVKGEKYWDISGAGVLAYYAFGGGISTGFGFFVADKWELGFDVNYYGIGTLAEPVGGHMIGLTPNFHYYHKLADRFYYTPGMDLNAYYIFNSGNTMLAGFNFHVASFEFRPTEHFAMSVALANLGVNFAIEPHTYIDSESGQTINDATTSYIFVYPIGLTTVSFKYYF